ncbi:MAG: tetratricopeptide repeat protein [Bacteroidales bacterium]|nr:tetratricopeptide repeat protein [Bacteroidales bacterium]
MKFTILFFAGIIISLHSFAQSYDEWIDKSFAALDSGKLEIAETALISALKTEPANPRNVLLLSNLGTIQRELGKPNEAIESYTIALAQKPKSTTLLQNRAALFGELGKSHDAIIDYTSILLIEPNNEDALYYRGLLYLQTGNYDLAEADFQKLMDLDSESFKGRKGFATLEKLRGNNVEAEKIYNYLIGKSPKDRDLYIARAELYFLTNRNARALNDINKVIYELGDDPYCYYLRARIKLKLYERDSAIKDIIKAKEEKYPIGELEELLPKNQREDKNKK